MNLFIDTCSSKIIIIIFTNKKINNYAIINNNGLHANNFCYLLNEFLKKNNCKYIEIKNIYFTNGPGTFIGKRVSVIVCKMFKLFNSNIQFFYTNSLKFISAFSNDPASLPLSKKKSYLIKNKEIRIIENSEIATNHDYANIDQIINIFITKLLKDFEPVKKFELYEYK